MLLLSITDGGGWIFISGERKMGLVLIKLESFLFQLINNCCIRRKESRNYGFPQLRDSINDILDICFVIFKNEVAMDIYIFSCKSSSHVEK